MGVVMADFALAENSDLEAHNAPHCELLDLLFSTVLYTKAQLDVIYCFVLTLKEMHYCHHFSKEVGVPLTYQKKKMFYVECEGSN